jgi:hypothetical protein
MRTTKHPAWLGYLAERPACFDPVEWVQWRNAATNLSLLRQPPQSPCEDCTSEYQAAMLAAKRCEHPEATFERDVQGFVRGVLPPTAAEPTAKNPTQKAKKGQK